MEVSRFHYHSPFIIIFIVTLLICRITAHITRSIALISDSVIPISETISTILCDGSRNPLVRGFIPRKIRILDAIYWKWCVIRYAPNLFENCSPVIKVWNQILSFYWLLAKSLLLPKPMEWDFKRFKIIPIYLLSSLKRFLDGRWLHYLNACLSWLWKCHASSVLINLQNLMLFHRGNKKQKTNLFYSC